MRSGEPHNRIISRGEPDWKAGACCGKHGEYNFFPEGGESNKEHARCRVLCDACPIKEECLDYALCNRIDSGFWGGMSERERRNERKRRQRRAAKLNANPTPVKIEAVA